MLKEYDDMKEKVKILKTYINSSLNILVYLWDNVSICLKCRKNTESKNPNVVNTKNKREMLLSKSAVCDSKKLKFIKNQEASDY